MDFSLPQEVLMIRNAVRQFVEAELLPLEREFDFEEYNLPESKRAELIQRVKDAGLWGLYVPKEYGGSVDIGHIGRVAVQEEVFSTLVGHSAFGRPIVEGLFLCNDDQKERYLYPTLSGEKLAEVAITEPGAGSDPTMMTSRAEERNGRYVLNGRKTFISGAEVCDFMLLFARLQGTEGREGITAFLVDSDMPGVNLEGPIPVIGMPTGAWTEAPYELSLDNVEVPESNVVGEPGRGWSVLQGSLGMIRLAFGARSVALSERCLKMARDYAVDRETFGRPIADRQAVQWMLSDSAIAIEGLRWTNYHAAWRLDQGMDARSEVSMIKIVAPETLERIADRAMQIHGAIGLSKELPLEHIYRAVRTDRIVDGASEIHRFVIARNIIRGFWFPGY